MLLLRSTLLTGAALAMLSTGADAHGTNHGLARVATDRSLTVLYDQSTNPSGGGTFSQNSGGGFGVAAADDFVVPKHATWRIKEIDVAGMYFNGFGPALSESVTFYADKRGAVGDIVAQFNEAAGSENEGSIAITLAPKGLKLKSGHYWVSVVVNLPSDPAAQWAWGNQTTTEGDPAMWEDPSDGYGTGCTTWTPESECLGSLGDHVFVLKGKAK